MKTFKGHKIVGIYQGPEAMFDVDTCPEREVIFRVWNPIEVCVVPRSPLPNATHDLISFEIDPEDAMALAEKLAAYAHRVIVREVMTS